MIDERTGLAVTATLFVDGQPCGGETCQVPSDAQMHRIQVRAIGDQDWELGIRAQLTPSRVRSGPVQLRATKERGAERPTASTRPPPAPRGRSPPAPRA